MSQFMLKLGAGVELSDADRSALDGLCVDRREMARGHGVVVEGRRADHIHVVVKGWAARQHVLAGGSRQITAFLLPGDVCDLELAVLPRSDQGVVALSRVTVAVVPRAKAVEASRAYPALARAFWWTALVDASIARTWLVNVGRRDASARLAHLLCELDARLERLGLADRDGFELAATQTDLADALGLTPVHVNRTMKSLREEGLVTVKGRVVTVLDADRLRRAAGFDPGYLHA